MELKQNLKKLMAENGITIDKLANESNVSPSNIKSWLGGMSPRKLDDVRRVALALGVSFEILVFGDETKPNDTEIKFIKMNSFVKEQSAFDGIIRLKIERLDPETEELVLKQMDKKKRGNKYV